MENLTILEIEILINFVKIEKSYLMNFNADNLPHYIVKDKINMLDKLLQKLENLQLIQ